MSEDGGNVIFDGSRQGERARAKNRLELGSPEERQEASVSSAVPRQIPNGRWQRVAAFVLCGLGILASLASTPFNGAGQFAALCFAAAGSLFFWGILLRYLAIIEAKLDALLSGRPSDEPGMLVVNGRS